MPEKIRSIKKQAPHAALSRPKKLLFAFVSALVVPCALLLLTEFALRAGGYGYPTSYFIERTIGGQRFMTENDKFGWRFFPRELARSPTSTRFRREKPPATYRIFLFGESAALGDPKPAYGMGRYLQILLQNRVPSGWNVEVIPVAMTAINSHAILQMARECRSLHSDFSIIYMGNNEMMGPFGANPISGPAAPPINRIRTTLALKGTRLGQLLENIVSKMRGSKKEEKSWEGMKTFLAHTVAPDAPERAAVRDNFRANVEDILRSLGTRTFLCTVASNLRDCAPFASIHTAGLSDTEKQRSESLAKGATNSFDLLKDAAARDVAYADLQFRFGEVAFSQNKIEEAFSAFGRARDSDALPFRTDSQLNGVLREKRYPTALTPILVDVEKEFARQSPGALPGEESFFDHVHFTFEGNYRVATILAEQIAPLMQIQGTVTWASRDECDRALGLTDWNRRGAYEHMLQRISEAPFTGQLSHARQEESFARRVLELRARTQPTNAAGARSIYEMALSKSPDDFRMRENFAEFLEMSGQPGGAAEQWQRISELLPYQATPFYHVGRLLAREKKHNEARRALAKSLEIRPDLAEAMIELGQIAYREGKNTEALTEYARAALLRPNESRLRIFQADALAAQGNRGGAMDKLREAITLRPNHWEAHYLLGIELAATNRLSEAIPEFSEVTRLRPDYAQAHFNLAVALAKSGKMSEAAAEFRKTVEIDPNHRTAREYLQAIETTARQ